MTGAAGASAALFALVSLVSLLALSLPSALSVDGRGFLARLLVLVGAAERFLGGILIAIVDGRGGVDGTVDRSSGE